MTLVLLAGLSAGVLQDTHGNVIPNRQINVYARGTSTPVQVYSDSAGASPVTQPLTTDSSGNVPGYVTGGVSVDIVDALTGLREQGEPLSASTIGTPGKRLKEDYGAVGNGIADDTAAVQAAANSALPVYVAPGAYLCNNVTVPDNAAFVSLAAGPYNTGFGSGATFRKNANGPAFNINGHNIQFRNISIDGAGGTFTGVGLNMLSSSDFKWVGGDITHTASYCVEWLSNDTGSRECFDAQGALFQTQGAALPAFHFPPGDTSSTDKQLLGICCGGGDLADLNGCQTVMISHCDCRNIIFGAASHKATIVGTRMATVGADTTVLGLNHTIVGNTHAGRFVIDSTCANSVVGPNVTVTQSVNNSTTCCLITSYNGNTLPEYSRAGALNGYLTPQPGIFPVSTTNVLAVASQAYLNRVVVSEPTLVTSIALNVSTAATANDNIDVGIYDNATPANRLSANGSTASLVNSTGVKNISLTTPVTLLPGKVYWIALAYGTVGGTAATVQGVGVSTSTNALLFGLGNSLPFSQIAASFPLPSTLTVAAPAAALQPILAARTS